MASLMEAVASKRVEFAAIGGGIMFFQNGLNNGLLGKGFSGLYGLAFPSALK